MRTSHVLALGAATVAVAGLFAQVDAQDPAPAKAPKLAVVDIGKMFQSYQRKDVLEKRINEQREALKAELGRDHAKVREMRRAFEASPHRRNSDGWLRERDRVKLAQTSLELKQERLQQRLKQQVEANTLQILAELERSIRAYGKRFGYTMIFKVDAERAVERPPFQEQIFRAQIGDVVYHDNASDITAPVIKYLNSPTNLERMRKF